MNADASAGVDVEGRGSLKFSAITPIMIVLIWFGMPREPINRTLLRQGDWTGIVYVGLGLSYLSVISNLFNFNLCGMIILVIVIIQAHRVISWAGQLRRAGIPLTARPGELSTAPKPIGPI